MSEAYVETKRRPGESQPPREAEPAEGLVTTARDVTRALVAAYPVQSFVAALGVGYLLGRVLARRR